MKQLLAIAAESMGTSSPEKVLQNFITVLQNASPQLKLAIFFLTPWAMLITAVSKYALIRQSLSALKTTVVSSVYASVSIPGSHPLNKAVLGWMVDQGLGKHARTLALTPPNGTTTAARPYLSAYDDLYLYGADGRRARNRRHNSAEEEDRQKQALSYVPEIGRYRFWWRCWPMIFERQKNMQEQIDSKGRLSHVSSLAGNEAIVISCPSFFAGARPIQEFLDHVKTMPAKENTTTIYRPETTNSTWDQGITRPSRNLNAVTLDAKVKDELVKDVETYLSPQTRKYYANRGIPWRRGFLFYGNPGTGKTSFSNALAGHLKLNIYMISLSNTTLTDAMLETLFEQLPSRCIVLLEDIDSAGIQRETMRQQILKSSRKRSKHAPQTYYDENGNPMTPEMFVRRMGGVTLSGLLNVLDGIHSKEGHVTVMTSNSPDSLDPALIRPGRIDRKVLFGYASREVISKLFVHIFSKAPEELLEGETAVKSDDDVAALADEFANIVPADRLTPAEVQGFLLVHRESPAEAVAEAGAWVQKTLATKNKGTNVEAFAGQEENKDDEPKSKSKKKDKKSKTTANDEDDVDDYTSDQQTSSTNTPGDSAYSSTSPPPSSRASTTSLDQPTPPYPGQTQTSSMISFRNPGANPFASSAANPILSQSIDIGQLLQAAGTVIRSTVPTPAPAPTPSPARVRSSMPPPPPPPLLPVPTPMLSLPVPGSEIANEVSRYQSLAKKKTKAKSKRK